MSQRILVVALNPALDITHELERVDWSGVNRPVAVLTRPGGKGLNAARTLHALGADVLVAGLLGGQSGQAVGTELTAAGVRADFTRIAAQTRRTFAVVDSGRGQTALFNEPGPDVSPEEYSSFLVRYEAELAQCAAVILSGSLPAGLPPGSYGQLTRLAAAAGVPVTLDAEGTPLLHGVAAGPVIVKPNLAELESAVGRRLGPPQSAGQADACDLVATAAAAGELRDRGARAVVVSLGADGLLAVTADGVWQATPPRQVTGNPTGAGDAVVAGLTLGLVLRRPWTERLRHAVALGSAAVAARVAGEFCAAEYQRLLPAVRITRFGEG